MKKIGHCRDKAGNITDLYEENGKYYRRNPTIDPTFKLLAVGFGAFAAGFALRGGLKKVF